MQIVRDLAGYTLGRSDLVRRAMSKKKGDVMEKERRNFVYGNPEEGVPGCASRGISEEVANRIYDSMIDFAKYAFNKSHAAAYAYVSFQTAWLKYYYPVEFMAALLTSVIDNPGKVAGYILTCKQMGIQVLPPDINKSYGKFSVESGKIRYGLSAIKGIGRPVMKAIEAEREKNGEFTGIRDFCERLTAREVNKRTVENFIKAGAFDSTGANRQQLMMVVSSVIDSVQQEKKNAMTGQMTLFDIMPEEDKKVYSMRLPNVPEFSKEEKLSYEKEVLDIYISGHPLEEYETVWRAGISAVTTDFALDEETNEPRVKDNARVVVGGMVTAKTIKYTKNNEAMAFLTLEDLLGSMEIIVFPKSYERYGRLLEQDAKVFIEGRVSVEEDRPAKLIFESMSLIGTPKEELWIRFADLDTYRAGAPQFSKLLEKTAKDRLIVIYLEKEKSMKKMNGLRARGEPEEIAAMYREAFGEENVKMKK